MTMVKPFGNNERYNIRLIGVLYDSLADAADEVNEVYSRQVNSIAC